MKKIVLLIILGITSLLQAQQRSQYTMYMANPYLVNPALVGSEDYVDIKIGGRQQWVGFDGSPRNYYITAHTPINKPHNPRDHYSFNKNWISLGGMILKDETGPLHSSNGYLTATYDFGITKGFGKGLMHRDGIRAVVGLSLGFNQWELKSDVFKDQEALSRLASKDPTIAAALNQKEINPDANVGVWVYHEYFFVGASAQQILANEIDFGYTKVGGNGTSSTGVDRTSEAHLSRHYFITGGVMLPIDPVWDFYPSFMLKGVNGAPLSFDLNGKIEYDRGKYWGGVSYRHGDAINVMLGLVHNYKYEFAYSYDVTTNVLHKYSSGTHEIIIGYRILPKWREQNAEEHWLRGLMNRHKNDRIR